MWAWTYEGATYERDPACPPIAYPLPAAKCTQLSADVGAMQAQAARQIEALKEGLARELRKQKVRGLGPGGEGLQGVCL